jgi:hypothetical protein
LNDRSSRSGRRLARALDNGELPDRHFVLTSTVEWKITIEPRMLTGALQPDLVVVEIADVARHTAPPLLAAEVLSPSDRRLLEQSDLTASKASASTTPSADSPTTSKSTG